MKYYFWLSQICKPHALPEFLCLNRFAVFVIYILFAACDRLDCIVAATIKPRYQRTGEVRKPVLVLNPRIEINYIYIVPQNN